MAFATSPLTAVERVPTEHVSISFTFRGLEVWGLHPAYPFSSRWSGDQARLARLGAERRPDLVLGDLNATLDNPPFRSFVRRAGLADAAEQAGSGWQPTWPVGGARGVPLPLAAIDHVLVGPRLAAVDTRTATVAGTDHKALAADLVLR
jgi:endonuclease/exonuclease/phosphatase family metal-dependent hydrolase